MNALDPIRQQAAALAEELKSAGTPLEAALRAKLIDVRTQLFQRGVFDPVLVRFDSITAPPAGVGEIAEALEAIGTSG